jgi:C4-type Zn-finger protein
LLSPRAQLKVPRRPGAPGVELRLALTPASGWHERRVLKSAFCTLEVPEIGLEASAETLAADLVTAHELLHRVYKQLTEETLGVGDEASMAAFLGELQAVLAGSQPATLVLRDPSGGSLVEGAGEADSDDPYLVTSFFEPTPAELHRIDTDVRS